MTQTDLDAGGLRACPCGGKPWVFGVTALTPMWQAGCDKCQTYGRCAFTEAKAIAVWNRRPQPETVSAGDWVLVPREATQEMVNAGVAPLNRTFSVRAVWSAMLAATPPAPAEQGGEGVREALRKAREWPADWQRNGYNHAFLQAQKALRYLAENDRPSGGEQFPNSASCYLIADELEATRKVYEAALESARHGG